MQADARVTAALPTDEPLIIYLSALQADVVAGFSCLAGITLPAWVSHRQIAQAMGFSDECIGRALAMTGGAPYLWATEFENVHSVWRYHEPELVVGGVTYRDSEDYYHQQKPRPFNAQAWERAKDGVMRVAIRAKLEADPILRPLLCATKGFPLLSIKPDAYWGVDPRDGGRNRLAELWMELRDEVC